MCCGLQSQYWKKLCIIQYLTTHTLSLTKLAGLNIKLATVQTILILATDQLNAQILLL